MKFFSSIRARVFYGTLAIALVPLLVAVGALAYFAYRDASTSLTARAVDQLTSIRNVKVDELTAYVESLETTVRVLAANPVVQQSIIELRGAFATAAEGLETAPEEQRSRLRAYYTGDFTTQYLTRNPGGQVDMAPLVDQLSPIAIALQYQYIAANPNPLGQKGLLDRAPGTAAYHEAHARIHGYMRQIVEQYGFFDVFLIDPDSGVVVYSYFKELDFATSLLEGPWAQSGLAAAFRDGRALTAADQIVLTDFATYRPSYDDGAAFFGMPVLADGQLVGVLAAQMPLDRIEAIASFRERWEESGLGATGELYLVGPDTLMRTTARGLRAAPASFAEQASRLGYEPTAVAAMRARNTTVGLFKVDSVATRAALAGSSGDAVYANALGERVLGAYAPIDLDDLRWSIVTEISEAEALAPVNALLQQIAIAAAVIFGLLALIAGYIATRLGRSINQPVSQLSRTVNELRAGNLDTRVKLDSQDELGELGRALDNLLDERVATLEAAARENEQLNDSVITIMHSVSQLAQKDLTARVPVTPDVTGAVSDAINLLVTETSGALRNVFGVANQVAQSSVALRNRTSAVVETAQNTEREVQLAAGELKAAAAALATIAREAENARSKGEEALRAAAQGMRIVSDTVGGVSSSRDQIRETEKRVKRLAERSNEISSVVNIINQIAERTAVLALNAGMQAAAAGEAGRGFAVVADEVKRLADSARGATGQISTLVSGIQADAADTMRAMNESLAQFVDISRLAERAGEEVQSSMSATDDLAEAVRGIAKTSSEQAQISGVLVERAQRIDAATQSTLGELNRQRENVEGLLAQAKTLLDTVRVFKLPGTNG